MEEEARMGAKAAKRQFEAIVVWTGLWVPEESQAAMLETYKNVLRWSEMIRDRPSTTVAFIVVSFSERQPLRLGGVVAIGTTG